MEITTKELCEILRQQPNKVVSINECIHLIETRFEKKLSDKGTRTITLKLTNLDKAMHHALSKAPTNQRNFKRALSSIPNGNGIFEINDDLFEKISIPTQSTSAGHSNDTDDHEKQTPNKGGRPKITKYSEMGSATKRRYVDENTNKFITEINDPDASFAIAQKIQKVCFNDAHRYQVSSSKEEKKLQKISEEEALALIINQNLSVDSYRAIRKVAKNHGADIFPSYYKINLVKKAFEPNNILVTDTNASIPLDDLCESTSKSLVESSSESMNEILHQHENQKIDKLKATLICMWGMDGTTGQSMYHQADSDGKEVDDHSLFVASMTPLKLLINEPNNDEIVLWQNPAPGSYLWNRCISLEYAKETDKSTISIYQTIQDEINKLTSHQIALNETTTLEVNYEFHMTMIDGKVAKVLSRTKSYQCCTVCEASPKQMNDLDNFSNGTFSSKKRFPHTIGALHTTMNVVSLLYKIACKKRIGKWQVRKENKETFAKKKSDLKKKIFEAFGVKFDEPRQGGSGTSSTGSVCRRMLQDPKKLAEVLELNEDLVCRLAVILKVISCKEPINSAKFGEYCLEVYKLYITHYNWYCMSATLHKLLAHGAEIIDSLPLSLGMMTEEGAEARNKYYRRYREFHARKTSRQANMRDIFVRSLISSDPKIATRLIEKQRKVSKNLPEEVREFLLELPEGNDEEIDEENLNDHNIFDYLEDLNEPFLNLDEDEEDEEQMLEINKN